MMNNAWKINDGDRNYGKGWSNKDESGPAQKQNQNQNMSAAGGRPGTASQPQTYSRPQTGSRGQAVSSGYQGGNNIFGTPAQAKPQQ